MADALEEALDGQKALPIRAPHRASGLPVHPCPFPHSPIERKVKVVGPEEPIEGLVKPAPGPCFSRFDFIIQVQMEGVLPMAKKSREEFLPALEIVKEAASRHAQAACQAIDLDRLDAALDESVPSRLDPKVRISLPGPFRHVSASSRVGRPMHQNLALARTPQ
jgi:hypothetical protein